MTRYEHLTVRQLATIIETQARQLTATGWTVEDQRDAERALQEITARFAAGKMNGFRKASKPGSLRIRDIKEGDFYKEDNRLFWTAVKGAKVTPDGRVQVKVRYRDGGTAYRGWDDGNYELPGLERP